MEPGVVVVVILVVVTVGVTAVSGGGGPAGSGWGVLIVWWVGIGMTGLFTDSWGSKLDRRAVFSRYLPGFRSC